MLISGKIIPISLGRGGDFHELSHPPPTLWSFDSALELSWVCHLDCN